MGVHLKFMGGRRALSDLSPHVKSWCLHYSWEKKVSYIFVIIKKPVFLKNFFRNEILPAGSLTNKKLLNLVALILSAHGRSHLAGPTFSAHSVQFQAGVAAVCHRQFCIYARRPMWLVKF